MVNRFVYPLIAVHLGAFVFAFLAQSSETSESLRSLVRGVDRAERVWMVETGGPTQDLQDLIEAKFEAVPASTLRLLSSDL